MGRKWMGESTDLKNANSLYQYKCLEYLVFIIASQARGVWIALSVAFVVFGLLSRYEKGFKNYKRINARPRDHAMEIVIIIGPSRTGKTRQAKEMAGEDVYYKDRSKWWEDYEGQHTVVWDEFYGIAALSRIFSGLWTDIPSDWELS